MEVEYDDDYTIDVLSETTEIELYDDQNFKSINGSNVESINVSLSGDVHLNGSNYDFSVNSSLDREIEKDDKAMGIISASANGAVEINKNGDILKVTSKDGLNNISTLLIEGTETQEEHIEGEQTDFTMNTVMDTKLLGDVDGDGNINSTDALIALKIAASLIEPTEEQEKVADVNKDNIVNSLDALLILKYAAKLIDKF